MPVTHERWLVALSLIVAIQGAYVGLSLAVQVSAAFGLRRRLLLAGAAHDARAAGEPTELAESDLTRALRAVLSQPDFRASLDGGPSAEEILAELEAAAHQVFLARKFYNDVVAATQAARRRWLARVLGLAGGAPMPEFFEIDDSLVVGDGGGRGSDMPHLTS